MSRQPLDVREWLEDMRRFSRRDADRAGQVLQMLDEAEDSEKLLEEWGERVGDLEDAVALGNEASSAIEEICEHDISKDFYVKGGLAEAIETLAKYAQKLEDENFAVRELAVAAGILGAVEMTTDIVPLLAMFLPSE